MFKRENLILGMVALFALGAIIWYMIGRHSPGNGSDEPINSDNPNYIKLRDRIDTLGQSPWSPSSYQLMQENIEEFAAVTPDPMLNEPEKKSLHEYLDKAYLGALGDSVISFCRHGQDLNQLNALRSALERFDAGNYGDLIAPARSNIDIYYGALNQVGAAYAFTQKPYLASTSNTLQEAIKTYQTQPYITENQVLQEKIQQALLTLIEHSTITEEFEREVVDNRCNCRLRYGKFRYYFIQCDSIQKTLPE